MAAAGGFGVLPIPWHGPSFRIRGQAATQILLIPPPEKTTARAMRPLWRDLIKAVWAVDPLQCPHCHSALRPVETLTRPEAIEFFLRLHGLWEGLVNIPPPPDAPFDIDTFEPIDPS